MATVPTIHQEPNVERGVSYWQGVDATVNGVLGGYGNGTLPLVDAQGSRTFLLQVLPRLSAIAPVHENKDYDVWIKEKIEARGGKGKSVTRALDCGAGVGRVSRDVLTRICDIVHIVEPVESFLEEAKRTSSTWPSMKIPPSKTPFQARKTIHFHLSTLQTFDPATPYTSSSTSSQAKLSKRLKLDKSKGRASLFESTNSILDEEGDSVINGVDDSSIEPIQYDVIWCQWCLQHLSDKDLVFLLDRAKSSLIAPKDKSLQCDDAVLDGSGIIIVKENVLQDEVDGNEKVWYDDEDHSITRTSNAYERVFREAGLTIVRTQLQLGLPQELFPVRIWCLRV